MKSPLLRKLALCLLAAASWLFHLPAAHAGLPGLPRERDAIYLEDFLDQPYRLRVLQDAAVFYNPDLARYLGTLRRGQLVELQAIDDKQGLLRVKGQAGQGQVAGWLEAKYVTALDPAFVVGLRRSIERRQQVAALTASGEIALGMTMDEVSAALGQPVKKTAHSDTNGVVESWEYLRYVTVPRTVTSYDGYGRLYSALVYQKVPSGSYTAAFSNGVVSAIDRSALQITNSNVLQPPVRTVTAPVIPTTPTGFTERDVE